MLINLSEETAELAYICAAVGRVSKPLNIELFEKLYDQMTGSELVYYHDLITQMEFSQKP